MMFMSQNSGSVAKELYKQRIYNYAFIFAIALLAISVIYLLYQNISLQESIMGIAHANALVANTITLSPNVTINNVGHRLDNIDVPLNTSELNVINYAPNSYFEIAANMLLNNTINSSVFITSINSSDKYNAIIINKKPTVIYIGALSCIFCGENRWAIALALSRFGNFSSLYKGYSSFGDGDLPTLYWSAYNYTTPSNVSFGNSYSSNYINFISADYESPVKLGFEFKPLYYFVQKAPNATYLDAMRFMNNTSKFRGTPFLLWGNVLYNGADAVILGNGSVSSPPYPLEEMTHAQVISQLKNFNDPFSYSEYAAADVYVSYICASINNSAPICQVPAIKTIEQLSNLSA